MGFPLPLPDPLRDAVAGRKRVLVALSGGVDSSVALALLHELGCDLHGVTFKNFCYSDSETTSEKSCCSLDAIADARDIAHRYSVRHWVTDVTELFQQSVIEPFVQEYRIGRTPNPCLSCNATVRFPELVRLADQLDLDYVATGHYARLQPWHGSVHLYRGVDPGKDQSYFLYRINRELFDRILFPLGWYHKTDIRKAAQDLGLPVASKHESQEICFVPTGDRSFLFKDDQAAEPGEIVNRQGESLGQHRGLVHYTVGQRRGLGIAAPEPLYVLELDEQHNRLVVGMERELVVQRINCDQFVMTSPDFPASGPAPHDQVVPVARVRHRHTGAAVKQWVVRGDELSVELEDGVLGAAPGQSLVLYRGDEVLGGGRIRETA